MKLLKVILNWFKPAPIPAVVPVCAHNKQRRLFREDLLWGDELSLSIGYKCMDCGHFHVPVIRKKLFNQLEFGENNIRVFAETRNIPYRKGLPKWLDGYLPGPRFGLEDEYKETNQ